MLGARHLLAIFVVYVKRFYVCIALKPLSRHLLPNYGPGLADYALVRRLGEECESDFIILDIFDCTQRTRLG